MDEVDRTMLPLFPPSYSLIQNEREREKSEQTLLLTTIRLEQTFYQTGSWYYGHQQP